MSSMSTGLNGTTAATRPWLVLLATSLGVLLAQIDTSVVNLALKSIGADLHAGVSALQWVIDAYNLVYASLLLTGGTLGDLYGRRRIFVLGIALFTVGTLTCALAPSTAILIGGRLMSGLGAAFALPMSLVLLTLAYPAREQRAHALGVWASCNGLAFIIGPTLGGWLVDSIGWRSIFYVTLPVCAAALVITFRAVSESAEPEGRRLDLPGQALAVAGLAGFAFAAIEGSRWGWTSPLILSIAAGAVAALALFVWVEARTSGPLVPLGFLRLPVFSASLAVAGLMTFGIYALLFIMPLYFQIVRGGSPFIAGLDLLPMSVAFVVVSQLVGHVTNRFGPRLVMTAGMACMGLGALGLAAIGEGTGLAWIELALLVVGIGLGLNTAPVNGVAVAAVPPARSGTASGMLNTARMVGATFGVAILGSLFAAYAGQQAGLDVGFLPGLRWAMTGGAAAELLGALLALAFIRGDFIARATLAAPALAKRLRRHAGLLAEEAREVGRVGEGQIVGDLVDRLSGEHELALGLGQHALADEMAGGHPGCALDVIVEPVGGHRQPLGVEADQPFFAEMIVDQPAQFLDARVGGLERHRAAARPAHAQAHHLDGNQRQQAAHRQAIALARERGLHVEVGAKRRQPLDLVGALQRHQRIDRHRSQPRQRLARLVAERIGHVLGEAHHPAVGDARIEAEAVRGGGRHQDGGRRCERHGRGLEAHLAAALLDQQHLKQVAVAVRADRPFVQRGARGDGLDMDEVERAVVRRIAVEMEQRQRGGGHGGAQSRRACAPRPRHCAGRPPCRKPRRRAGLSTHRRDALAALAAWPCCPP